MEKLKTDDILDILDKMEFFGGCRAGRELWASKPEKVQNKDIENFNRDIQRIKDYILNTRKPMERIVERLEEYRNDFMSDIYEELRDDSDNLRANRIIERFDTAIEIVKDEMAV